MIKYTCNTLIKYRLGDIQLTLSPPIKSSSAQFLVCFNFRSDSISLKVCENVRVSKSLYPVEKPSRYLIWTRAVCICHVGCDLRAKVKINIYNNKVKMSSK